METRYYYMIDIQNPYCEPRLVYENDPGLANIPLDIEEGQALIMVEGEKLEDPGRVTVREVYVIDGKVVKNVEMETVLTTYGMWYDAISYFCLVLKAEMDEGKGG
jgi:hypothetical protein